MAKITFHRSDPTASRALLPRMFAILSANMRAIAPTGGSYEEDWEIWSSYMTSEHSRAKQILLMYAGEVLAGYFQYTLDGDTILIEEVEILPAYQRTWLFYQFLRYVHGILPEDIAYAEAYIDKRNTYSQRIAQKLGMQVVGGTPTGRSFRYRGDLGPFRRMFRRGQDA